MNLGWTKVYSPIDGIAGVSNSQVGDLVGTATKMTTVSQVNPIWAYFNISESRFLEFAPEVTKIITGRAPLSSAPSDIEYIQSNDQAYPAKGKFIYVNRQVGTSTGTIQMAAQFANPDAILRPGGFGRVRIRDRHNQRRATGSPSFGNAGAIDVPGSGGYAGKQSGISSGEGGRSRRHQLDHHRRTESLVRRSWSMVC